MTEQDAERLLGRRSYFGAMMVRMGDADGLLAGLTSRYADSIRPALEVIGLAEGHDAAAGVYIVIQKERVMFFADGSVNIDPDRRAARGHRGARRRDRALVRLRSGRGRCSRRRTTAACATSARSGSRARSSSPSERWPQLVIDGEMQADIALDPVRRATRFGFSEIKGEANVLVFPNLDAAHIATRMIGTIGGATVVGPILMGMRSPVNSLQRTATVDDIVNLAAITVLQAQKEY